MANPRRIIDHKGIGFRALTFFGDASTIVYDRTKSDGSVSAGLAVGLVAGTEDTVELVIADQAVLGKLLQVDSDNACVVQVEGVCELAAGDAITLVRGKHIVGALGAAAAKGYIKTVPATTGSYVQATAQAALDGRHTVLKIADPTKAQVLLSQ